MNTRLLCINILVALIIILVYMFTTLSINAQDVSTDISAACSQNGSDTSPLCTGFNEGKATGSNDSPIVKIIKTVIDIMAFIGGAIAIIYVVYGGFKYITSAGNSEKAVNGRQTIIYALIGLILIVVAQQLVLFIISKL